MLRYSLIIPHFNDSDRLERLLRTVPVGRLDLEVIVVDDCSPDQSVLDALKARWARVRWLSTRDNAGAGAARNVGLAHAQGEYLVFADADDEFIAGAFDVFDQHVGPDDDLVYFLAQAVQEVDGSRSNRADRMNALCTAYLEEPNESTLKRLKLGHGNPVAKVYSRRFIEKRGVRFEETRVSNDVAFNVLAAVQAEHVRAVPVAVYRVFRRAKSMTADPGPVAFLERVRGQARLAGALKSLGIEELPSATGWMLVSLAYGPLTAFRTWRICLRSELRTDISRIFQASRWRRFMQNRSADQAEKKSAD
ncbi:glycosyltransferase family 2 protein [Ectothiorhodospiraceae bacterium 2226]|nr:glycosyltransferase family 2 protein [Ectothiorhodospiraceae bacterium 2226]